MQNELTIVVDQNEIGALESHKAHVLVELKTLCPSVIYRVFLVSDCDFNRDHPHQRRTYPVEIHIYGRACDAEHVGHFLAAEETYLQEPENVDPGIRYLNPHMYSLDPEGITPRFRLTFQEEVDEVIFGSHGGFSTQPLELDLRIVSTPHQ